MTLFNLHCKKSPTSAVYRKSREGMKGVAGWVPKEETLRASADKSLAELWGNSGVLWIRVMLYCETFHTKLCSDVASKPRNK